MQAGVTMTGPVHVPPPDFMVLAASARPPLPGVALPSSALPVPPAAASLASGVRPPPQVIRPPDPGGIAAAAAAATLPSSAEALAADGGMERAGEGVQVIQTLLQNLGLMQYFSKFLASGFDTIMALEMMTEADMREDCGMTPEDIQVMKRFFAGEDRSIRAAQEAKASSVIKTAVVPSVVPPPATKASQAEGAGPGPTPLPKPPLPKPGLPLPRPPVQAASCKPGPQVQPAGLSTSYLVLREALRTPAVPAVPSPPPPVRPDQRAADLALAASVPVPGLALDLPPVQQSPVLPGHVAPVAPVEASSSLPLATPALTVFPAGTASPSSTQPLSSKVPPGVRAMLKSQPLGQPGGSSVIEELGDPVAVAMAAAQQPGGAANTLYTLAQMAQESAQYAQQAAALTSSPMGALQALQMADAAEQASQRAAWATIAVSAYEPPDGGRGDSYIASIKQICQQASETAEQAASTCRTNATNAKAVEAIVPAGPRGEKRSRVPCGKFFESGLCQKGSDCPLSHNPSDKKPLPLWQKRQYMCTFFEEDKCIRGASCAFAHGPEELEMIKRFKAALKDQGSKPAPAKRPGDWDCPGCGDRQFARNGSCRKCGEPRPIGGPPLLGV